MTVCLKKIKTDYLLEKEMNFTRDHSYITSAPVGGEGGGQKMPIFAYS